MITLIITLYIIPMILSIVIAKIKKDFDYAMIGLVPVVNMGAILIVILSLIVNAIDHLFNKLDTLTYPLRDWFEND